MLLDDRHTAETEKTYYECSGWRKTFYALSFIILLPFFVSLPVMLGQRLLRGVWLDTWGLAVLGVGFLIIMTLILLELVFSLRAKVDIGSKAMAFTLPARGAGLTPTVFYRARTIPYDDIAAIQSYCNVYGGTYAPVVLRAVRLVLKSGERVLLGYVNDVDEDPRFPFKTIARQISERAGVPVSDLGHVRYEMDKRIFGMRSTEPSQMPPEAVAAVNRGHNWFLTLVIVAMAGLLVLGIGNDFWQATGDLGERAVRADAALR